MPSGFLLSMKVIGYTLSTISFISLIYFLYAMHPDDENVPLSWKHGTSPAWLRTSAIIFALLGIYFIFLIGAYKMLGWLPDNFGYYGSEGEFQSFRVILSGGFSFLGGSSAVIAVQRWYQARANNFRLDMEQKMLHNILEHSLQVEQLRLLRSHYRSRFCYLRTVQRSEKKCSELLAWKLEVFFKMYLLTRKQINSLNSVESTLQLRA